MISLLCILCGAAQAQKIKIKTGIEVLKEQNFKCLEGKRVGLITNPTGVDNQMKSTIDILHETPNVNLVALYGPEHGVRGDVHAGDHVTDITDATTGLPVYSLYGKTRKATPEMLKDIDVLVYDIQDNGCRSFTYISTMGLAMEAAAENGKALPRRTERSVTVAVGALVSTTISFVLQVAPSTTSLILYSPTSERL